MACVMNAEDDVPKRSNVVKYGSPSHTSFERFAEVPRGGVDGQKAETEKRLTSFPRQATRIESPPCVSSQPSF